MSLPRDDDLEVRSLNRLAVAGVAVSGLVAILALFAVPALRRLGLSFGLAFWVVSGVELLAALGVAVSVRNLYDSP